MYLPSSYLEVYVLNAAELHAVGGLVEGPLLEILLSNAEQIVDDILVSQAVQRQVRASNEIVLFITMHSLYTLYIHFLMKLNPDLPFYKVGSVRVKCLKTLNVLIVESLNIGCDGAKYKERLGSILSESNHEKKLQK